MVHRLSSGLIWEVLRSRVFVYDPPRSGFARDEEKASTGQSIQSRGRNPSLLLPYLFFWVRKVRTPDFQW